MIDVKYGEIDVKNNGGWRKRRIYFSEIFPFLYGFSFILEKGNQCNNIALNLVMTNNQL